MADSSKELINEAALRTINDAVNGASLVLLNGNGLPLPAEFVYNPSRIERDVHPLLFNDGWFRR